MESVTMTRRRKMARQPKYKRVTRPRCPEHGCEMLVYRTVGALRYCACPIQDCEQTAKQTRERVT